MEPVNIIGGGIGGLALGNALQCQGIDFKIFEQAPRLTEIGAAISISKAAIDILEKFDLHQQVKSAGYETRHFHISDKHLNKARATTTEFPLTIIHRAKLIDILCSKLPKEKIELNSKLTSIKSQADFSELNFSNGLQLKSGCTAIADGINSISRTQIFPEIKIRYAGQAIWRGITSIKVPDQFYQTYTEIWHDKKRFLFVPVDNNSMFWLAVKNAAAGGIDNQDSIRQELLEDFNDFHPIVKELLQNSANFIRSDLADLGSAKRKWYENKIVFLGDSIHATTPNLGQGGCQAIEDAYCLSLLMKADPNNYSEVFPRYQKLREKKVSFIVGTSWRYGKTVHHPFLSGMARRMLKYLPTKSVVELEKKLNDLSYLNQ